MQIFAETLHFFWNFGLFWFICSLGLEEVTKLLLENGANVNGVDADLNTALHALAKSKSIYDPDKQYKIAEILINNGADVSVKNKNGDTPIALTSNNKSNFVIVEVE